MPTGYTNIIGEGATFRAFATRCARAMGATITQRDESLDSAPRLQEPSDYHDKQIQEKRARLRELASMSQEDCDAAARADFAKAMASWQKNVDDAAALRGKYDAMLAAVKAWKAPTPEHEGLRRFMAEQIEESIRFDCGTWEAPKPRTGAAWLADEVASVTRSLAFLTDERQKEIARTADRNAWIVALLESLPG